MFRSTFVLAALAFATAAPISAQELGGLHPFQAQAAFSSPAPGCRLSQTNVAVGVNRALASGSLARQRVVSNAGSGGCRPLVSTQIVAGVNLGLGSGSAAEQTIEAATVPGILATTNFNRGVNIAVGAQSAAQQRLLSQIGLGR
jgi:hypothetical protein